MTLVGNQIEPNRMEKKGRQGIGEQSDRSGKDKREWTEFRWGRERQKKAENRTLKGSQRVPSRAEHQQQGLVGTQMEPRKANKRGLSTGSHSKSAR